MGSLINSTLSPVTRQNDTPPWTQHHFHGVLARDVWPFILNKRTSDQPKLIGSLQNAWMVVFKTSKLGKKENWTTTHGRSVEGTRTQCNIGLCAGRWSPGPDGRTVEWKLANGRVCVGEGGGGTQMKQNRAKGNKQKVVEHVIWCFWTSLILLGLKMVGGSVVERLPGLHEALDSILSSGQKAFHLCI